MSKALVLFSGGQDSTTCLVWAKNRFDEIVAVTFDYGQRHDIELECAQKIAQQLGVEHIIQDLDVLNDLCPTALTRENIEIAWSDNLPNTFVPGRNLVFLSFAGIIAYQRGISDIVSGVCQTDFSGYPDCREHFIKSLEQTMKLALDFGFVFHTPLMHLSKKETVLLMRKHGGLKLLGHSHTCYEGKRPACGKCPACLLRIKGFLEAGIEDPLQYEL